MSAIGRRCGKTAPADKPLLIRKNKWGQWVWICRDCYAKRERELATTFVVPEAFLGYLSASRNMTQQQALTEALTHSWWEHHA